MRRIVALSLVAIVFAVACGSGDDGASPTATSQAPDAAAAAQPTATAALETLAFLRDGDIWLVNADGSDEHGLGLANVTSFFWVTPTELDATLLLPDGTPDHQLVNVDGSTEPLSFPAGGSWSRDGTLYVVPVDDQVVVFDRDGSEQARLDVEPPIETGEKPSQCGGTLPDTGQPDRLIFSVPALSPDNSELVVAVNCELRRGAVGNLLAPVLVVPLDGSGQRSAGELQANVGRGAVARFSPDGAHVAVTDSHHISACAGAFGLQVLDLEGAESRPITLSSIEATRQAGGLLEPRGGVVGYDWSPQSDAVVASFNLSDCGDIGVKPDSQVEAVVKGLFLVGLDYTEETLVDGPTRSPAWSPAGRYIAYVEQESFGEVEPPLLRVLDLTTRDAIDLGEGEQPAWQPQE